ncbi:MAG: hypothetical protein D6805_01230 [Planctomycetota bacterium]|nr:MAG: hypothetical protein D6805_01230 [Planctomycetota bacterium]
MRKRILNYSKYLFLLSIFLLHPISLILSQEEKEIDARRRLAKLLYQQPDEEKRISFNVRNHSVRDLLSIIASKADVNILVDKDIKDKVSIKLINVHWKNAMKEVARAAGCVVEEVSPVLYHVTKPPTVTMEFVNAKLTMVLELLASQAGSNIILSKDVQGIVSLNLRDVHWLQALDTIVKTAGFVAVREGEGGKIIRVVTKQSLRNQLETEIIPLQYVRPEGTYKAAVSSAANSTAGGVLFVGEAKAPGDPTTSFTLYQALRQAVDASISEQVIYDASTNAFIVRATKPTINKLKEIINKVDVEPLQVFIDIKFVRTTSDSLLSKGIRFNQDSTSEEDGIIGRLVFNRTDPTTSGVLSPEENNAAQAGQATGSFRGIFPFDVGEGIPPFSKRFRLPAVLDVQQTLGVLRLIKSSSHSRIVQAPTILTLNHKEATIFVGESVPFAAQNVQFDQSGNATVTLSPGKGSPISIGFSLFITPHIIPETDKVLMQVIPKSSILTGVTAQAQGGPAGFERFSFGGAQGTFIDLPRTQDQIVVTTFMVENQNTAVIGGLYTESTTELVSKVPILSSIPIIGELFTYRQYNTKTENLLIFVTPTIVRSTQELKKHSMKKIIDFANKDYFFQKSRGNASDGKIHNLPVSKEEYSGVLNHLYFLEKAEKKYKETMEKVYQAILSEQFPTAMNLLKSYPKQYASTQFAKKITAAIQELPGFEVNYLKAVSKLKTKTRHASQLRQARKSLENYLKNYRRAVQTSSNFKKAITEKIKQILQMEEAQRIQQEKEKLNSKKQKIKRRQ